MFDIEKVERKCKLSRKEIERIKKSIKKEFPHDKLMYELHVIRSLTQR